MDNIKITKNLVTLQTVRRGDWFIKISVMNGQILLIASHLIDLEKMEIRTFYHPNEAFNFIDFIIGKSHE